ncbi:MAG: FadR/GntR family transcriptional regulator [Pseudonocardia sp.]
MRIGAGRPAYRRVADELRDRIVTGSLTSGQRLPNEADLGLSFGVSRSTVREALRVLASQHLVTTQRGVHGGSFVSEPDPMHVVRDLGSTLGALVMTPRLDLTDLVEVRLLLEPAAARLAAERADAASVAAIAAAAAAEPDPDDPGATHLEFHTAVLAGAGNLMLTMMVTPVTEVLRGRLRRGPVSAAEWDQLRACHQQIAGHIVDGDGTAAQEAMRRHLSEVSPLHDRICRRPVTDHGAPVSTGASPGG